MTLAKNYSYSNFYERNTSNHSNDRILELTIKDKTKPKNSIGLVDNRLFTGGNRLHAIQEVGLWRLKYDQGKLPRALDQRFTGFSQLLKVVKDYFELRNIEIKEIVDSGPTA